MNEFDAKYMKISSKYLQDKISSIKLKKKGTPSINKTQESSIKKFVREFFKSSS